MICSVSEKWVDVNLLPTQVCFVVLIFEEMGGAQGCGQWGFDLPRVAVRSLRMMLTLPWGNPFIVLIASS